MRGCLKRQPLFFIYTSNTSILALNLIIMFSFRIAFTLFLSGISVTSSAQLKPGFNKEELLTMLTLSSYQIDTPWVSMKYPLPENLQLNYRSPVVALDNRFDVWINPKNSYAIINTRGTTGTRPSWLENFHAAMVPANGSIQLSDSVNFEYRLANNPRAAVHVGWLIAMGTMAPDVVAQVKRCYQQGIKHFYLTGHSQGGGITFLLTAYLYQLQKAGQLPKDIRFKTYCTAGPKPGNLYFAYDYEYATRGGWAFNVTHALDWVPEVPFSIQTVNDFNPLNPFTDVDKAFKKMKFPMRFIMRRVYKKLSKHPEKAKNNFQKYLGEKAGAIIIKQDLPGYEQPEYYNSNHYMRCGQQIILMPDKEYENAFPYDPKNVFLHHMPAPYLHLAQKMEGY